MQASRKRLAIRRFLLRGAAVVLAAAGTGLLKPAAGLAANIPFPREAFRQRKLKSAMVSALGTSSVPRGHVTLTAPTWAEDGHVVPLAFESDLPDVRRFHVFVDKNPMPYIARLHMLATPRPKAELRIKMDETSPVHVIAETAGGDLHRATKKIRVSISGCGD